MARCPIEVVAGECATCAAATIFDCSVTCTAAGDCPDGTFCVGSGSSDGRCVAKCGTDAAAACQCPTGRTLQNGKCVQIQGCIQGQTACGSECCSSPDRCIGGRCQNPPVTCSSPSACPDPSRQTCLNGECGFTCRTGDSNFGCPGSLTCCSKGSERDICRDLRTSNASCGDCGNACPSGSSCQAGVCVCSSTGQKPCGSGASAACCTTGETCSGGKCCPNGLTNCGGICTSTLTDAGHCGENCVRCTGGKGCVGGVCTCLGGFIDCGGTCVDVRNDANHCGNCSPCTGGKACVAGVCTDSCEPRHTKCPNGECRRQDIDPTACGSQCLACNTQAGETCQNGKCTTAPCPAGTVNCFGAGVCSDTSSDRFNCGACSIDQFGGPRRCNDSQICAGGSCKTCDQGQQVCDNVCVDIQSDPKNCGACGISCGSGACLNGACAGTAGPCPECGTCWTCSDAGQCSKGCQETCLAGSLCLRAHQDAAYLKLEAFVLSQGFVRAREPEAGVMTTGGAVVRTALGTDFANAGTGEKAALVFVIEAGGQPAASAVVSHGRDLLYTLVVEGGQVKKVQAPTPGSEASARPSGAGSVAKRRDPQPQSSSGLCFSCRFFCPALLAGVSGGLAYALACTANAPVCAAIVLIVGAGASGLQGDSCTNLCDNALHDDLQFDIDNCDKCGNACRSKGSLKATACCFGQCVDTRVEREFCGSCVKVCDSGATCKDSTCQILCGTAQTACAAGQVCCKGQSCQAPKDCCGDLTVCGGGTCCAAGLECNPIAGVCLAPCPDGQPRCPDQCCDVGFVCNGNSCVPKPCDAGKLRCGEECCDAKTQICNVGQTRRFCTENKCASVDCSKATGCVANAAPGDCCCDPFSGGCTNFCAPKGA